MSKLFKNINLLKKNSNKINSKLNTSLLFAIKKFYV